MSLEELAQRQMVWEIGQTRRFREYFSQQLEREGELLPNSMSF